MLITKFSKRLIALILVSFFSLVTLPSVHAKPKPNVTILTASWCHYCTKMRQFLNSNNVTFTEYDIEKSNLGYQLYRSLGGKGVPVTKIDENVIYGYDTEKLKRLLNAGGYNLP